MQQLVFVLKIEKKDYSGGPETTRNWKKNNCIDILNTKPTKAH